MNPAPDHHRLLTADYCTEGMKNRAEAAAYFLRQFVERRLEGVADTAPVREILAQLVPEIGEPATEAPDFPMQGAPETPTATETAQPASVPDPSIPSSVPAEEDDAPQEEQLPAPDAAAAALLSTMGVGDAIHQETAAIYDLCKQRDGLQEEIDALQAKINAGKAEADASERIGTLNKQRVTVEADIQHHRSIRMVLQEKEAKDGA